MADLSITAANVAMVTQEQLSRVQFGETVTAGVAVYRKTSDNKYWKANCTDTAKAVIAGIVIVGGAANAYGYIATTKGQTINIGATVTVATEYVVSDTDGLIMPAADLTIGQYFSFIGVGATSANIMLNFHSTLIAHP